MQNITMVEPHYDDAWINLGGFILKHPEVNFKIISVSYDGVNNKNETEKISNILPNVKTKALKFRGIHWNLINKIKKENYQKFFLKINKLKSLSELARKIREECINDDLVLMPLGTLHPQHVVMSNIKLELPTKYYIEWPYCYEEKGYFDRYINTAEVIDISGVIKKKMEIFSSVYKSQSDLLRMVPKAGTLLEKNIYEIIIPHP